MEKAIYNGELIYANKIALDYETEKAIRKASSKGLLLCPDEWCKNKRLKYCHGEKKDAYFAHVENTFCDYADFDRKNTYTKDIRIMLYTHFKESGYDVDIETKLLPHHRAQLVFNKNENPVAVEIGTKFMSAGNIDEIDMAYKGKDIPFVWLAVGELSFNNLTESDLGFIKRYIVNESKDQSCVVIDYHSKEVIQFKFRDNKTHKDDYFAQVGSISDLIFENGTISLQNFSDNYDNWLNELLLKEKENISNSNIYDEEYSVTNSYSTEKSKESGNKFIHNPFDRNSANNAYSYWIIEYRNRHLKQKLYNNSAICDRVFVYADQKKHIHVYPCPLKRSNVNMSIPQCESCEYMFKETGCSVRINDLQSKLRSMAVSAEKDAEGRLTMVTFPKGQESMDQIKPIGRSIPSLIKSFNVQTRAWFINIRDFISTPEINPKNIDVLLERNPEYGEDVWIIYNWDF